MDLPGKSQLWPELLRNKDDEVREWSRVLRHARPAVQAVCAIPPFTLTHSARLRLVVAVPRDWAGITAETDRLARLGKPIPADARAAADPTARLRELCNGAKKDFVAIAIEADALDPERQGRPARSEADRARRREARQLPRRSAESA